MNAEEVKRLESEFHLVGVDSSYGREVKHQCTASGMTKVKLEIFPAADLCLSRSMLIDFEIPSGYPSSDAGPIAVIPEEIEPFRSTSMIQRCPDVIKMSMGKQELHFPWLADSKYPISVWFFTTRNLLKIERSVKSAAQDWSTPLLLRSHFPHKRRFHRNIGSTQPSNVRTRVGTGKTRGKRPYMEDTSLSFNSTRMNDAYPAVSIMGVFDGHGGQECALYASDELPGIITSVARREGGSAGNSMSRGTSKDRARKGAALPELLYRAFQQADEEWMRTTSHSSGSTACVMLFDNSSGRAYIGNAGDTRAVVCRAGKAIDLTIDRKATDPDEIARIAVAGGHVSRGRVMGSLAVARAFGDAQLKKSRGFKTGAWSSGQQAVLASPEVTSFRPSRTGDGGADDEFCIIATDGLWDVMTSQQAVDSFKQALVMEALPSPGDVSEDTLSKIANGMAAKAVQMGSQDNVTVMIIMFTGTDGGYNSDDDDGGYVSDEENVSSSSSSNNDSAKTGSSAAGSRGYSTKEAMERDLNSLLENIPSQYQVSGLFNASEKTSSYSGAPQKGSNSDAGRSTVGTSSKLADDELDMDFLLDDSNF